MAKTILITGATDGIGLETAKTLVGAGHNVLVHGRNPEKLKAVETMLAGLNGKGSVTGYLADLSLKPDVEALAKAVRKAHDHLDVLINNAGVFKSPNPVTAKGLDVRFVVNTIAPYLLTQRLLPLMDAGGRVLNLSSAAQSPVDLEAFEGRKTLPAGTAYAQSKLAIAMWSRHFALTLKNAPIFISVNPGSLLATKMVKEGYGMAGNDIRIGSEILTRLALDNAFDTANGKYYDNDMGQIGRPHSDALNPEKTQRIVDLIEAAITTNAF